MNQKQTTKITNSREWAYNLVKEGDILKLNHHSIHTAESDIIEIHTSEAETFATALKECYKMAEHKNKACDKHPCVYAVKEVNLQGILGDYPISSGRRHVFIKFSPRFANADFELRIVRAYIPQIELEMKKFAQNS